jgi:predicted PhzF superfamily epimerase YddE/YHI9
MARSKHLRAALLETSRLHDLVRTGMAAFARADLGLIAEDQRIRIGDSLDLDAASRVEHPDTNRWDYIVSIPDREELIGIEPHTAKDAEISVVIAKKKHAAQYLRNHLKNGCRIARWFWVSHGTVGFSKMDRARRRLDQNGIKFAGRLLRTLD